MGTMIRLGTLLCGDNDQIRDTLCVGTVIRLGTLVCGDSDQIRDTCVWGQ